MKAISRLLAVLAVLLLTGCGEKDHPVRTSLVVDTSTMTLSIGESAVRMATSKAEDAVITYTSSNPAVATYHRVPSRGEERICQGFGRCG